MSKVESKSGAARPRSFALDGDAMGGREHHCTEEDHKEEGLAVFRELAMVSAGGEVREYVHLEPRWW